LIPCAGAGQRALVAGQPVLSKQYQILAAKPMVLHTLQALMAVDVATSTGGVAQAGHLLVVTAPDDAVWAEAIAPQVSLARPNAFGPVVQQPIGGASRAQSVLNGLQYLSQRPDVGPDDWVLVHDAARCLVRPEAVEGLIAACLQHQRGGLLAQPLADTLKVAQVNAKGIASVATTASREGKWLAQTPQMFPLAALRRALENAAMNPSDWLMITDEASAMERMGVSPMLVPGGADNFKVTYPSDFAMAEAILTHRSMDTTA
jgi:2-C-methyl-D-erythritol 4-phosphate cytidylyltransferase